MELIKDAPLSPFKTIGNTERPDIVAAKLLEGKIAVIVEGTPVVLTLPLLFIEYLHSNEDYYINFYFSSINRMLRILGFFISISVPAVYVSLVTFHQELIPTQLDLSIAAAKEGIPFPTIVEALAMLLAFEILRGAGTAIFKKDKLVGFINGDETKYYLFIINKIKGGLLAQHEISNNIKDNISIEIFKSNTKLKPDTSSGELVMTISIKTDGSLAELGTGAYIINEKNVNKTKAACEKSLENDIKKLIKKVQTDYNADIFGFGKALKINMPQYWRSEASNWDKVFKDIKVDVNVNINIENSALTSKPIKIGD